MEIPEMNKLNDIIVVLAEDKLSHFKLLSS